MESKKNNDISLKIYTEIKKEMMAKSGTYKLTIKKQREMAKNIDITFSQYQKVMDHIIEQGLFDKTKYKNNKIIEDKEKVKLEEKRAKARKRQKAFYKTKKNEELKKQNEYFSTTIYVLFEIYNYFEKISKIEDSQFIKNEMLKIEKKLKTKNGPSKKINVYDFIGFIEMKRKELLEQERAKNTKKIALKQEQNKHQEQQEKNILNDKTLKKIMKKYL